MAIRRTAILGVLLVLGVLVAAPLMLLYFDSRQVIDRTGEYVALGSSYAAGPGLGDPLEGSPRLCRRTSGGYPELLAPVLGMRLVNNSCSGATAENIVLGGQFFLGPQVDVVGPDAKLVTITAGGNDVAFVGDMMALSGTLGWFGWLRGSDIEPFEQRDFGKAKNFLVRSVEAARKRAPDAAVMLVTYPTVLPPEGTCAALGLDEEQAELFRKVESRLLTTTREAATESGAILVDAGELSKDRHACSSDPWIAGASGGEGAYHPTPAGAQGVADAIAAAWKNRSQPSE